MASIAATTSSGSVNSETMTTPKKQQQQAQSTLSSSVGVNGTNSLKPPPTPSSARSKAAATPSTTAAESKAVSVERKEELLIAARANRIEWIYRVPLPYRIRGIGSYQRKELLGLDKEKDTILMDDEYDDDNVFETNIDHPFTQNERLINFLESNYACTRMSSTTRVLSYLYGMYDTQQVNSPEQVADRIEQILRPAESDITNSNYESSTNNPHVTLQKSSNSDINPNGQPSSSSTSSTCIGGMNNQQSLIKLVFEEEMNKLNTSLDESGDTKLFLLSYKEFWQKLQTPECALLVQGIRNFATNFDELNQYNISWKSKSEEEIEKMDANQIIENMSTTLKGYIDSTYETLKGHVAWKKKRADSNRSNTNTATSILESSVNSATATSDVFSDHDNLIRRSLESFIYGHCYKTLTISSSVLWKHIQDPTMMETDSWVQRLNTLQFITPKHLDIKCLTLDSTCTDDQEYLHQVLKSPIQALQSLDKYYSPYEKLSRVLKLFQNVNVALSNALNKDNITKSKKLPSADDILPTIILTILQAKPKNILFNIRFIEIFCKTEALRGEAGYAYTNLYGAVQFIQDFDLENPTSSLSITLEEFRKYTTQQQSEQFIQSLSKQDYELQQQKDIPVDIPAREVREARVRGEHIDYHWAVQWQKQKKEQLSQDTEPKSIIPSGQSTGQEGTPMTQNNNSSSVSTSTLNTNLQDLLPDGFSRQYTYLSTRPEELRIADLPLLLKEYKVMVRSIETLLNERATYITEQKKQRLQQEEQQLLDTVREYNLEELASTKQLDQLHNKANMTTTPTKKKDEQE